MVKIENIQVIFIVIKILEFRDHLDLCHFVNVQEKSGVAVEVICLICNFKTNSL